MFSPSPEDYRDYLLRQYGPAVLERYDAVTRGQSPCLPPARKSAVFSSARQLVFNALGPQPLTCNDIAARAGLSRSCANAHLLALVQEGRAVRSGRIQPGYRYALAPGAEHLQKVH